MKTSYVFHTKLPLSKFKGEKLQKCIDKSYGSCVVHIA